MIRAWFSGTLLGGIIPDVGSCVSKDREAPPKSLEVCDRPSITLNLSTA